MPKKIALLIGVSECGTHLLRHSEAPNSVAAMQGVLQDPSLGAFDQVEALFNPDVESIQKAIQQELAKCGINDLALIFFSGHAIINEEGRLYFTTRNTALDDYKVTAMPASLLQQALAISDAKRQVLILDCCYSSDFAGNRQTEGISATLKKELGAKGRTILTSSTAIQASFELEGASFSPYTHYFIEGIETGAADRDGTGLIYLGELHNYAKAKVQQINPQIEPDIISHEGDYDLLLTVLLNQDPNNDPETEYLRIEAKYFRIVESYERLGETSNLVTQTLIKKQKTFGLDIDQEAPDELTSDRDIDYTRLRDLLKAGEWEEADKETLAAILKVANREREGYLNINTIENFPCTDLHTIDQLWVKYSSGQFGFSVQKEVWRSVGGEFGEYNNDVYEEFGMRVGWRDRSGLMLLGRWKKYEELSFSLTWAPVGHLPTLASGKLMRFDQLNFWGIRSDFYARMEACWI